MKWARTSLDRETGDPDRYSVRTVRVEDDRVHAVVSGTTLFSNPDADRLEFYFEGATPFYRGRADGERKLQAAEPNEVAFSSGDFTGKSRLESVGLSEAGTETVDGEELRRFSDAGPATDDDEAGWFSVQALVDDDGLVHSFQRTLDETQQNTRRFENWYATDLGATTADRPDWVDEYRRTGTRNFRRSKRVHVIPVRFVAMLSTFFLVMGALLVGDALHGSVVTGQYSVTSPAAVFRAVGGLVCIAIGARFRTSPSEYTSLPSEQSGRTEGGGDVAGSDEFDPELSPLSNEDFERLESDDEN